MSQPSPSVVLEQLMTESCGSEIRKVLQRQDSREVFYKLFSKLPTKTCGRILEKMSTSRDNEARGHFAEFARRQRGEWVLIIGSLAFMVTLFTTLFVCSLKDRSSPLDRLLLLLMGIFAIVGGPVCLGFIVYYGYWHRRFGKLVRQLNLSHIADGNKIDVDLRGIASLDSEATLETVIDTICRDSKKVNELSRWISSLRGTDLTYFLEVTCKEHDLLKSRVIDHLRECAKKEWKSLNALSQGWGIFIFLFLPLLPLLLILAFFRARSFRIAARRLEA